MESARPSQRSGLLLVVSYSNALTLLRIYQIDSSCLEGNDFLTKPDSRFGLRDIRHVRLRAIAAIKFCVSMRMAGQRLAP
jgi:hypothetical protein